MNHGPKEKRERALGVRLGLKGDRAMSPKSAMSRKPYRPGVHGPKSRPRPLSEFGVQMREKSKAKLMYGIDDKNLKRIFGLAKAAKGALGAALLEALECRLDNVVFRLGFTPSRGSARQLVVHGHVVVNGKKVTSPGFVVNVGDTIAAKKESATKTSFAERKETLKNYGAPSWLHLDFEKLEGKVLSLPKDTEVPFEINLLVESFSR